MSAHTLKPLGDKVFVKPAPPEQKTSSGVFIPSTAQEKSQQGHVVAVGPGERDKPLSVKVGDRVLYRKYSGSETTVEGETYLVLREGEIDAVILTRA